jgi:hypothetical protein
MCEENGCSQDETAARLQSGIAVAAAVLLREPANACGNDEAMERVENQNQVFHLFHGLLEISQRRRDSHIPTGSTASTYPNSTQEKTKELAADGKVEIQKQDSHFPTAANRLRRKVEELDLKTKKGAILPAPVSPQFQDHLVLESKGGFSIILRLENAVSLTSCRGAGWKPAAGWYPAIKHS